MQFVSRWLLVSGVLLSAAAYAQPALRLKARELHSRPVLQGESNLASGHHVFQFDQAPTAETVATLNSRGFQVLADVPDNALLVSASTASDGSNLSTLGVRYTASFT